MVAMDEDDLETVAMAQVTQLACEVHVGFSQREGQRQLVVSKSGIEVAPHHAHYIRAELTGNEDDGRRRSVGLGKAA